MGGSITVHSDGPGHGATFTLELPVEARARLDAPVTAWGPRAAMTLPAETQNTELISSA